MQQFCKAFPVCLRWHSLGGGVISHIALRLLFFLLSFFCVCSVRANVLGGRTRLLLLPGEGKSTFVLCGDETWRCLHTYKLTPCCWRGGQRDVRQNQSTVVTCLSFYPYEWAYWIWIVGVFWVVVCQDRHSLVFPVCIFTSVIGYLETVRCLWYCLPFLQAAFAVRVSWSLGSI